MLRLSEIMIAHPEVETFEQLVLKVREIADHSSERFFKIDVKPDFSDVPENWEDRLEASFY